MFARTDTDDLLHIGDPDLAVTDFACAGGLGDEVKNVVHIVVINDEFHLHFGNKVDLVFRSAVSLGVPAL